MQSAALIGQFFRLVWRSRPILFLAVVFLLIGPLTIGARIYATRTLPAPRLDSPRVVLLEYPTPRMLGMFLGVWQSGAGLSRVLPGPVATLFTAGAGQPGLTLSAMTLADVYLFILPLMMLLIGGNILPHDERIYGTLFSLPTRKGLLYLYQALALTLFVILLVVMAFLVNLAVLRIFYSVGWTVACMIGEYHFAVLLFSLVFAFLGVALSVVFRERSVALALGLAIIILVTAVIPPVQSVLSNVYSQTHRSELITAKAAGSEPTDAFYRLVNFLSLTPSLAFSRALENIAVFYTRSKSEEGCISCQDASTYRAWITERYMVLSISFGMFLLLGGAVFVRKEATVT